MLGPNTSPLPSSYSQRTQPLTFTQSMFYEPPSGYDTPQPSHYRSSSQNPVVVTEWTPESGPQGTPIYIYLESDYDLNLPTSPKYSLMFGAGQCPALLTRLVSPSAAYKYVLTAEAPAYLSTEWHDAQVPMYLHVQDHAGTSIGTVGIGSFRFVDQIKFAIPSSQGKVRKRKLSSYLAETWGAAAKRAVGQEQLSRASQDQVSDLECSRSPAYLSMPRSYPHSPLTASVSSYEGVRNDPRRRSSTFSTASVQSIFRADQGLGWASKCVAVGGVGKNPAISAATSSTGSPYPPTPASVNPPLIRTSQMKRAASLSSHELDSIKASLHINGNLDSMTENWTLDEQNSHRRLVQFWRSQNGRFVSAGFNRIAADDKVPKNGCVNCIYWAQHDDYYVTSVDAIALLHMLTGQQFVVEEKNRVRRNFSGVEPTTIKKDREDTKAFFHLIMGLPDPKPRNIAKAIKVYPWKDLGQMLKKVMQKYSADYSFGAGRPPGTDSYALTSQSGRLTPSIKSTNTETYPSSTYSTPKSSNSSVHSGVSNPPSSTTSPNLSHGLARTVYRSPSETKISTSSSSLLGIPMNTYNLGYSNLQASYPTSESGHSSAVQASLSASLPLQPSWNLHHYSPIGNKYALTQISSAGDEEEADHKAHVVQGCR
ncbi:MAG: hypothetical protein Q9219_000712 [cf. Caloplaca sp. 3 TL-2023]